MMYRVPLLVRAGATIDGDSRLASCAYTGPKPSIPIFMQLEQAPVRIAPRTTRWLVLIGVGKLVKAVFFVALGFGALRLVHRDLVTLVTHWVTDLRFDPESRIVNFLLNKVSGVTPHRLRQLSVLIFCDAALDLIEGTGLILGKSWAEYLTLIVTASFLPWEFFEILRKPSWPKAVLTLLNILVVIYLAGNLQRRSRGTHPLAAD